MKRNTSPHILNTAANLLGFCLFVITSLHISNKQEATIIDGSTCIIAFLLTVSCVLSFVSIRSVVEARSQRLEEWADYFFIISLIGILLIITLITLNFIQ